MGKIMDLIFVIIFELEVGWIVFDLVNIFFYVGGLVGLIIICFE